jgi:hypothetical protein
VLDVIEPLLAFGGEKMLEGVLAERVADQIVLFQFVERFVEIPR